MKIKTILISLCIVLFAVVNLAARDLNILIVTGGHNFDRVSFFTMFDAYKGLKYKEIVHPEANIQLGTLDYGSFDAVV